jgi:hypothetical protein
MSREEALARIEEPGYREEQCKQDLPFVLKKLGFSRDEFDQYIHTPRVEHSVYGVERGLHARYPWLGWMKRLVRKVIPK